MIWFDLHDNIRLLHNYCYTLYKNIRAILLPFLSFFLWVAIFKFKRFTSLRVFIECIYATVAYVRQILTTLYVKNAMNKYLEHINKSSNTFCFSFPSQAFVLMPTASQMHNVVRVSSRTGIFFKGSKLSVYVVSSCVSMPPVSMPLLLLMDFYGQCIHDHSKYRTCMHI